MKKLFCLLCVLFLLPVVSFADYEDSKYCGVWMYHQVSGMASRIYTIYELDDNGKAYYSREEFRNDGSSAVETSVMSWIDSGDTVDIMNDGEVFQQLYYVDDTRLSMSERKNYNFFHRVLKFSDDVEALYTALPPEPNYDPCGKWSFCLDIRRLSAAAQKSLDDDIVSYDLYLFSNGAAYMVAMSQGDKSTTPDFSAGALSGIWIGDRNDMTIRISELTYKASIDDDGRLLLKMTDDIPFVFIRVDSNDAMSDHIK